MNDVVELARALIDIPSVTGDEERVGRFLHERLKASGWDCRLQEAAPKRFNVAARRGHPKIVLTTHIDTVPPFFPSREDDTHLYGRGSCDAKGIAAAMVRAAEDLVAEGVSDLGLLFVVGEETDSAGAAKALELGWECDFLIDGEPTDNHLAIGHKGVVQARVAAHGKAAHSAYPEQGRSAIDALVDVLVDLRRIEWPESPDLGVSHLNVGRVSGGRAANVIADQAEALLLIRSVAPSQEYVRLLGETVGDRARLEILKTTEPQRMETVEGFAAKSVAFGTDIPVLRRLGRPLLFGPGSILDAHTADEKVSKRELRDAVRLYAKLTRALRAQAA